MKVKYLSKIILVSFLVIGSGVYYEHQNIANTVHTKSSPLLSNVPKKITTEEGISKIKNLTKNSSEQIKYTRSLKAGLKEFYMYDGDSNEYTIDSASGNMVGLHNKVYKYTSKATINIETALSDAQGYIKKYMQDTNFDNMKLIQNELQDHGSFQTFNIKWKEYKNNTYTGNSISIIMEGNGELENIIRTQSDQSFSSQEVKISEDEAKKIAYRKLSEILKSQNPNQIVDSQDNYDIKASQENYQGNLVWDVEIGGIKDNQIEGNTIIRVFFISVSTGDILYQDQSR